MNEFLTIALVVVTGALLGIFYFGGLWITLNRGLNSNRLGIWLLVGFLVRSSIVLAGFYWVGQADWQRFAACLLGFFAMRQVLARWLGPAMPAPPTGRQEPSHAS